MSLCGIVLIWLISFICGTNNPWGNKVACTIFWCTGRSYLNVGLLWLRGATAIRSLELLVDMLLMYSFWIPADKCAMVSILVIIPKYPGETDSSGARKLAQHTLAMYIITVEYALQTEGLGYEYIQVCASFTLSQSQKHVDLNLVMFKYLLSNPDSCHQTCNIRHTLAANRIVDHSDVVVASPVSAAPTTS